MFLLYLYYCRAKVEHLRDPILKIQVCDNNRFQADTLIGECCFDLREFPGECFTWIPSVESWLFVVTTFCAKDVVFIEVSLNYAAAATLLEYCFSSTLNISWVLISTLCRRLGTSDNECLLFWSLCQGQSVLIRRFALQLFNCTYANEPHWVTSMSAVSSLHVCNVKPFGICKYGRFTKRNDAVGDFAVTLFSLEHQRIVEILLVYIFSIYSMRMCLSEEVKFSSVGLWIGQIGYLTLALEP